MPAFFVLMSVTGGILGAFMATGFGLGLAHSLAAYVLCGLFSAASGCILTVMRANSGSPLIG